MKRMIIAQNLLLVLAAALLTWSITAFLYQNTLINEKLAQVKGLLYAAEQMGAQNKSLSDIIGGLSENTGAKFEIIPTGEKNDTPEVTAARNTGYGERTAGQNNILESGEVYAAGRLSDGSILRVSATCAGGAFTLWSFIPPVLIAFVIIVRLATLLVSNIEFFIKGAAMTVERAGNEGGVEVKPAPELLQYDDLIDCARELAKVSTQVSRKVKALYVENKRIDYLLNNMNEGLAVLDRDMKILVVNKSALSFFDAGENVKGRNVLTLTHAPGVADALAGVVKSDKPEAIDIKSPDGKITLQILMSAVHDEEENTDGAIMLISDVTAVRMTEQIRSEFVANASHELKTPLTSIKGFSELIDTGIINDPEKAHIYLERIRSETERMIVIISDILKLSELEATTRDTGLAKVSLRLLAQKVCDSLVNQISEKGAAVTVSGDIGVMEANSGHMEQMLLNLIDNAVKYNKPGGRVDVIISQSADSCTVSVADTGIGIPKEAQQRVFERFYRVDKSRSRKQGGTGLGLSIVKHIVELYQGSIELDSELNEGTTIKVTLPICRMPEQDEENAIE